MEEDLKQKRDKGFVLVPENDTHKQSITDVYKIFKTSFRKEYDSDEDLFYTDVIHHLEMHSASTYSEIDSRFKYTVEDNTLKHALEEIPKWPTTLPKNFGTNVCVSLSCKEIQEESPLTHLEDMGIKVIEYVKLKIGYTYLKFNLSKILPNEKGQFYTSAICPGLSGGIEDPIVLRMLHMQYINREDYLKWIMRSRKKDETKKNEKSYVDEGDYSEQASQFINESTGVKPNIEEHSGESVRDTLRSVHSNGNIIEGDGRIKEELSPPSADEKRVIKLTQYEVMDQELPDDIEIFWPGKRDLENDFVTFINALHENLLYQEFVQKYKSGKLEQLDDDAKADAHQFFVDVRDCKKSQQPKYKTAPHAKSDDNMKKLFKCNYERLNKQFKDYKISQDYTMSLFENVSKEKIRLEDLNLCCIVNKLKDLHKASPDAAKDGELIWKDVVVIKTKSKEEMDTATSEKEYTMKETKDEKIKEEKEFTFPEYKSMIYVTKVFPDAGQGYMEDKCRVETDAPKKYETFMKGGCTGYSMRDYKVPVTPECGFKIATSYARKDNSCEENNCKSKIKRRTKDTARSSIRPDDYVTLHTNWSNYPYTEMLDVMYHRHHKGYIYVMDKFEIAPDTNREIDRIFRKTAKYSEKESRMTAINSFNSQDQDENPVCCRQSLPTNSDSTDQPDFPFPLLAGLKHYGEENITINDRILPSNPNNILNPMSEEKPSGVTWLRDQNIELQNLEIQKYNGYLGEEDSSGSSSTEHQDHHVRTLFSSTSEISSVIFDNHKIDEEEIESEYNVNDYMDSFTTVHNTGHDEDDYSDIVDFIKNFKFGYEQPERMRNYEGTKEKHKKEKGIFVDISSLYTCQSDDAEDNKYDEVSVNTDDTSSLKDFKGLIANVNKNTNTKGTESNTSLTSIPPRKNYFVHGVFFDALIDKRKCIIRELRTSFPLNYLYLALLLEKDFESVSGKLSKYKKYFNNLDNDYERILLEYKLKDIKELADLKILNTIQHQHLIYEEVAQKNIIFNEEMYSMTIYYPYIRHLFIRESFEDTSTNLSFFLLHLIENDKFIKYCTHEDYANKMHKEVGKFVNEFRNFREYKNFLMDMIILHYFQTKHYYTINDLFDLDSNWGELLTNPRKIIDGKTSSQVEIPINYKDCTIQDTTEYSYLFYNFIKQFNNNLYESDLFRQFIEPELHPNLLNDINNHEIADIIQRECREWCDLDLIGELEEDIINIMNVIWECEILGINRCRVNIRQIRNRFSVETGFYFRYFFPNTIVVTNERHTKAKGSNSSEKESSKKYKDIWMYNREFKYWYNKSCGKTVTSQNYLKTDNLFKFERLLTKCLIRYIISYYDYRIHG